MKNGISLFFILFVVSLAVILAHDISKEHLCISDTIIDAIIGALASAAIFSLIVILVLRKKKK
ncbi:MAG: hypothetical protein ACJ77K_17220 [Bacteroidia bacterium]